MVMLGCWVVHGCLVVLLCGGAGVFGGAEFWNAGVLLCSGVSGACVDSGYFFSLVILCPVNEITYYAMNIQLLGKMVCPKNHQKLCLKIYYITIVYNAFINKNEPCIKVHANHIYHVYYS